MSDPVLHFLGAAGTVTGSRTLLESGGARVLVDCGLFQGYKALRERNRAPFPVPPESIDAIVLTHAHLDHSGYLPRLVREGYRGRVYCTPGTRELCGLLLPDSGHLLEEEARYAALKGFSRHAHPLPLYTEADARAALRHLEPVPFDRVFELPGGIVARFSHAGHILGAAQVTLEARGRRIHLSGDLGRPHDALMRAPADPPACDVLVCESTYGDRSHPDIAPEAELGDVVRRVGARGGVLVVPAFAVGRAQQLMLQLARLRRRGAIPKLPVVLDSPMAVDASAIYRRHADEHRIDADEVHEMFASVRAINSVEESKALDRRRGPMIIISASGMLTGGRVLHHVAAFGGDPRNAILLSGFQAGGTRGADLAAGRRMLRMFGRDVAIRAEVVQLAGLSAHADGDEILAWLRRAPSAPGLVCVNHGEAGAADTLRARIRRELGWRARVPLLGDRVPLGEPATAHAPDPAVPA